MLHPMLSLVLMGGLMALIAASVKRIPEGQVYTLRRIGGQTRTLNAGMHWKWPLIERVIHRIRLLGNVVEIELPLASGQSLRGAVYVQVVDAQRADPIVDSIDAVLRGRIAHLVTEPATEDDATRNRRLKAELNREIGDRGLLVTRVQLTSG